MDSNSYTAQNGKKPINPLVEDLLPDTVVAMATSLGLAGTGLVGSSPTVKRWLEDYPKMRGGVRLASLPGREMVNGMNWIQSKVPGLRRIVEKNPKVGTAIALGGLAAIGGGVGLADFAIAKVKNTGSLARLGATYSGARTGGLGGLAVGGGAAAVIGSLAGLEGKALGRLVATYGIGGALGGAALGGAMGYFRMKRDRRIIAKEVNKQHSKRRGLDPRALRNLNIMDKRTANRGVFSPVKPSIPFSGNRALPWNSPVGSINLAKYRRGNDKSMPPLDFTL